MDLRLQMRLTLAEITRSIVDLEDTRDGLTKSIADLQERVESIRAEIRRLPKTEISTAE